MSMLFIMITGSVFLPVPGRSPPPGRLLIKMTQVQPFHGFPCFGFLWSFIFVRLVHCPLFVFLTTLFLLFFKSSSSMNQTLNYCLHNISMLLIHDNFLCSSLDYFARVLVVLFSCCLSCPLSLRLDPSAQLPLLWDGSMYC